MWITNIKIRKRYITYLQVDQSHMTNEKVKLAFNLSSYIKSRKSSDGLKDRLEFVLNIDI